MSRLTIGATRATTALPKYGDLFGVTRVNAFGVAAICASATVCRLCGAGQEFGGEMLAREVGQDAVFNVGREFVRPLVHGLERNAELPSGLGFGAAADDVDGVCLEHAPLNHSSNGGATRSSLVQRSARTLPHMDTFGERLAHAIDLAGVTREQLALKLDVSVQAISQVIRGKAKAMTAENAAEAAVFLGVDIYWLATGKGEPRPEKEQIAPDEASAKLWVETARWAAREAGNARIQPSQFLRVVDFMAANSAPAPMPERSKYVQRLLEMVGAA